MWGGGWPGVPLPPPFGAFVGSYETLGGSQPPIKKVPSQQPGGKGWLSEPHVLRDVNTEFLVGGTVGATLTPHRVKKYCMVIG